MIKITVFVRFIILKMLLKLELEEQLNKKVALSIANHNKESFLKK